MAILPHYFSPNGPGAALGVERAGQPAHVECLGLADMSAGVAIEPDTVFDLASASKMFTGAALMLLAERGALALTAPVREFLPQLDHAGDGRPISIRDLLWHTSGLPDYLEAGMYTPATERTAAYVREQLPEWSRLARPGEAHCYSNTNYVALAMVIEAAAGCAYADFIESSLIAPFGLRDTFVASEKDKPRTVARGYRNLGFGLPLFVPAEEIVLDTLGDGGVFSSLRDLLQWQALLWRGEIISHDSLAVMGRPGRLDCGTTFEYGFGCQVEVRGDGQAWCGHGGSWTGSTVLVGRYPEAETSVVVLSNEFMAPVERISQAAFSSGA